MSSTASSASTRMDLSGLAGSLALALLLLAVLLPVASAQADSAFGERGALSGQFQNPQGIAVSRRNGDVYLADAFAQRIDEFTSAGSWVRAFGWGVVPGAATGTGDLTKGSNIVTNFITSSGSFAGSLGGFAKLIAGEGLPAGDEISETPTGQSQLILSRAATISKTGVALSSPTGPGNIPTNEVQKLSVAATSGTYALSFGTPEPQATTETTAPISWNAAASALASALEALPGIGAGSVSVSGGPGDATGASPYLVEFTGRYADTNVRELTVASASLSGGSSSVGVSTPTEGGGVPEVCTTICSLADGEEEGMHGFLSNGSHAGRFASPSGIAIDNDPASPSYGDVYVTDPGNDRIDKYSPSGEFLLMFGAEVDKTTHAGVCTEANVEAGDTCGAGVEGTDPGQFSWTGGNAPIAVGPDGRVYVGDKAHRVQTFSPEGVQEGELNLTEAVAVDALAVDSESNLYVHQAGEGKAVAGVQIYDSTGTLQHTVDAAGSPSVLTAGASNQVFVGERGERYFFRLYDSSGAFIAKFTSDKFINDGTSESISGIGVNAAGTELYATNTSIGTFNVPGARQVVEVDVPQPGPPVVKEEKFEAVEPTTATLKAVVNPGGYDTHAYLEYGTTTSYGSFAPSPPPGEDIGRAIQDEVLSAGISGLSPATEYHFRAVAESECEPEAHPGHICRSEGLDRSFTTLPPIAVKGFTTQLVGPETVEFKAELSPDNGTGTEYTICYGSEAGNYDGGCASGAVKAVGNEFELVSVSFEHLTPKTEYHYQLTARNSYGEEVSSADQTFVTEETVEEEDARASCPNALRREEGNSLALPDCRSYEQVTPPEKAGYPARSSLLSPSGERVGFDSIGAFAGAESNSVISRYLAHRTADGWSTQTTILRPSGDLEPFGVRMERAAELGSWIYPVAPGATLFEAGTQSPITQTYFEGRPDSSLAQASPTLTTTGDPAQTAVGVFLTALGAGSSADLSRVYFFSNQPLLESDPLPQTERSNQYQRLYEFDSAGAVPSLRLVAEVPSGLADRAQCEVDTRFAQRPNPASADGSTVFYDLPKQSNPEVGCGTDTPNKAVLYARTGEQPPVELSAPPAGQCHAGAPCESAATANAHFVVNSPDARLAWFTTKQPLIDSDTDGSSDLYLAKLSESGQLEELVQASAGEATSTHPTPGEGSELQGVVRVSADGTRAYFVAHAVLTEAANGLGQTAAAGAENLYAYDAESGQVKFAARLCSGPEQSGMVSEPACPADLSSGLSDGNKRNDGALFGADEEEFTEGGGFLEAHVTPDGRFLVFASFARLTSDDTDNAKDVYRYDFQTGQLMRVSIGRRGNDGNGNDDTYSATITTLGEADPAEVAEDDSRAISADGSVVVFRTAAPLVSRDTNAGPRPGCGSEESTTGCDVYEWEAEGHGSCREAGGCVSLVSDGVTLQGASEPVISASGRDITFVTSASLLRTDTDGVGDVYDARELGGFPFVPPAQICPGGSAEACHGPGTAEGLQVNPVTEGLHGGGDGPHKLQCAKGKHKVKKHNQVRCVPNQHHTQGRKSKHHHRHARAARAAKADRGGSK